MITATGTLFLGKTAPLATTAADGTFALTLLAFDRIGPHQIEPWRVTWCGDDAAEFWHAHQNNLTAGQPLHACLNRIRTFSRSGLGPEFVANVVLMYLAPLAHQVSPHSHYQESSSCPQSPSH
jgi:hypothetical protein